MASIVQALNPLLFIYELYEYLTYTYKDYYLLELLRITHKCKNKYI